MSPRIRKRRTDPEGLAIWVGVCQTYDSSDTEMFEDREIAMGWLKRQHAREMKDAATTFEFWASRGREMEEPTVTDIEERYGGFAEFRTTLERYFIQERSVIGRGDDTSDE